MAASVCVVDLRHVLDTPDADLPGVLHTALLDMPEFTRLLQRHLERGSIALFDTVLFSLIRRVDEGDARHLVIAVHYASMLTGCSCADDPSPISPLPEYVELAIAIARSDGMATLSAR